MKSMWNHAHKLHDYPYHPPLAPSTSLSLTRSIHSFVSTSTNCMMRQSKLVHRLPHDGVEVGSIIFETACACNGSQLSPHEDLLKEEPQVSFRIKVQIFCHPFWKLEITPLTRHKPIGMK